MASITQTEVVQPRVTLSLAPSNGDYNGIVPSIKSYQEYALEATVKRMREALIREERQANELRKAMEKLEDGAREAEKEREKEAHEREERREKEAEEREERRKKQAEEREERREKEAAEREERRAKEAEEREDRRVKEGLEREERSTERFLQVQEKRNKELFGVLEENWKLIGRLRSRNKDLLIAKGCYNLRGAIDICLVAWGEDSGYPGRMTSSEHLLHALVETQSFKESLVRNSAVLNVLDTTAALRAAPKIYIVLPNRQVAEWKDITVEVIDFDSDMALGIIGVLGTLDHDGALEVAVKVVSDGKTFRFKRGTLVTSSF